MVFCVNRTSKVIFIYGAGGYTGEAAPKGEAMGDSSRGCGFGDYL